MRKIRQNTFETNSSSTHNLCIVPTDLFQRWINNDNVWFCSWDEDFISIEDIEAEVKNEMSEDELNNKALLDVIVKNRILSYEDNGYRPYSKFGFEQLTIDLQDGRTVFSFSGYDY